MIKGFIHYNNQKMPFVINNFHVELFSDSSVIDEFRKEYRSKKDFVIEGEYSDSGVHKGYVTFLVEHFFADVLHLHCYILSMIQEDCEPDEIGFESPFLDDIFKYKYNYIDKIRENINLDLKPYDIYSISFIMNNYNYQSKYRIGRDHRWGLLEDFDRKGELRIPLQNKTIQECYYLSTVINRLAMFITSYSKTSFKRITLYKNEIKKGWMYSPIVSESSISGLDILFGNFDAMKYIPKILNNIAMDSGNQISHSIPLGHIKDDQSIFSPQRFIEQIMAFEYLYDKIDHQKAQNIRFPLKEEIKEQLNNYPDLLSNLGLSSDVASEKIKEIRRKIAHGYEYWYDFSEEREIQRLMILLDKLIVKMSLHYIGFADQEIDNYCINTLVL